ncbi:MAG: HAD-IA family hydrolase [Pseudomonadales bacterium]|jgi:putative hydrolase of the HAD superfamily|nr:HAD-IA family hydrolase [Pseudomonadales bacterium]
MIKAVLWDFGGVLTTSPFEAFASYEKKNHLPKDFIRSINATNPDSNAWALFESSQVSIDEFDGLFQKESALRGHKVPGKDVLALLSGTVRPAMVQALRMIKKHYQVGCITNNVKSGQGPGMSKSENKAQQVAAVMALFDTVIESSVLGIRKPNPEIYQIACAQMAVDPAQALFIDDLGINLKPARAMGMATIKVLTQEQAINDLEQHLQLDLRSSG